MQTNTCLEALAATVGEENCEIIVIDNGSTDDTVSACEERGKSFFGVRFLYKRLETDCNFGPASNIGAQMARGEYLLFLNNDLIP